jgi:hypothetical protein
MRKAFSIRGIGENLFSRCTAETMHLEKNRIRRAVASARNPFSSGQAGADPCSRCEVAEKPNLRRCRFDFRALQLDQPPFSSRGWNATPSGGWMALSAPSPACGPGNAGICHGGRRRVPVWRQGPLLLFIPLVRSRGWGVRPLSLHFISCLWVNPGLSPSDTRGIPALPLQPHAAPGGAERASLRITVLVLVKWCRSVTHLCHPRRANQNQCNERDSAEIPATKAQGQGRCAEHNDPRGMGAW